VLSLVSTAIVLCCFFRVQNVFGETSLFVPEFIRVCWEDPEPQVAVVNKLRSVPPVIVVSLISSKENTSVTAGLTRDYVTAYVGLHRHHVRAYVVDEQLERHM
jgi:hypothetical protein